MNVLFHKDNDHLLGKILNTYLPGEINRRILSLVCKNFKQILNPPTTHNIVEDFTDTNILTESLYLFLLKNKIMNSYNNDILGNLPYFRIEYINPYSESYKPNPENPNGWITNPYAYVVKKNYIILEYLIEKEKLFFPYTNKLFFQDPLILNIFRKHNLHQKLSEASAQLGELTPLKYFHPENLLNPTIFENSIESSNLETIQWLHDKKYPYRLDNICKTITSSGNINIISWLTTNGYDIITNEFTIATASNSQSLKFVTWLYEKGCKFNKTTFNIAAYNGNLKIMEYLHQNNCPSNKEDKLGNTLTHAIYGGNLESIKWLIQKEISITSEFTFELSFLLSDPTTTYHNILPNSTKYFIPHKTTPNYLNIMHWFTQKGHGCQTQLFERAIDNINYEIMEEILSKQSFILDRKMFLRIFKKGNLPFIEWIMQKKYFYIDENSINIAIEGEHVNVIKWCLDKGIGNVKRIINNATKYSKSEILKHLHSRNRNLDRKSLLKITSSITDIDWLISKNLVPKNEIKKVIEFTNFKILKTPNVKDTLKTINYLIKINIFTPDEILKKSIEDKNNTITEYLMSFWNESPILSRTFNTGSLLWLLTQKYITPEQILNVAITTSNIEITKLIISQKLFPINRESFTKIMKYATPEIMTFLVTSNVATTEEALKTAIVSKNKLITSWLNNRIMKSFENSDFRHLKRLIDRDICRKDILLSTAINSGNLKVLDFLKEINIPFEEESIREAISSENMNVINWIIEVGHVCSMEYVLITAIEMRNRETVKYLKDWYDHFLGERIFVSVIDDLDAITWLMNSKICTIEELTTLVTEEGRFDIITLLNNIRTEFGKYATRKKLRLI